MIWEIVDRQLFAGRGLPDFCGLPDRKENIDKAWYFYFTPTTIESGPDKGST